MYWRAPSLKSQGNQSLHQQLVSPTIDMDTCQCYISKIKKSKDQTWANLDILELITTQILIIILRMEEDMNAWVELAMFYIERLIHLLYILLFVIRKISC